MPRRKPAPWSRSKVHNRDMGQRLRDAHQSALSMSEFAGRLLKQIESLERDIAARDLLIQQLKSQLSSGGSCTG